MARTNKTPEERRGELLDCAQALFFAKGYEGATINDIMVSAGVSKGGFYHHFTSKAEVLEALAARMAHEAIAGAADILAAPDLDSVSRLNAFLARARRHDPGMTSAMRSMYRAVFRQENLTLYYRLSEAVNAAMTPVLADLLARGISEGRFRITDPDAVAEIILQMGTATRPVIAKAMEAADSHEEAASATAAAAIDTRLNQHGVAIDRLLGLPDGSIRLVEPGFGAAWLRK